MAPHLSASTAVGRDITVVIGWFVLLGVLSGVLWWVLVSPAEFTKLPSGGSMGEVELGRRFNADGWYVVIAAVFGLASGLALTWWRSRDPLLTSLLLILGSAVAAALMMVTGHLLGPGPTRAALASAKVGARVPERLDVDTFVIYLTWPIAVFLGALVVLLGKGADASD
jgi:hypothetical protein